MAARSESGRNDVQIAARPEPTATADAAHGPAQQDGPGQGAGQRRCGGGRGREVVGDDHDERVAGGEEDAVAEATVQSRTPSAIASASGPCPETESPSRRPRRQTTTAASRVRPSGTAVTWVPATWTPEPWAISQPSAPTRSPSRGAPWAPASVRNQPTTPAGEADQERAGRGDHAGEQRQEHQRAAMRGVRAGLARGAGTTRGRQQRGHGLPIITRRSGAIRAATPGCAGSSGFSGSVVRRRTVTGPCPTPSSSTSSTPRPVIGCSSWRSR